MVLVVPNSVEFVVVPKRRRCRRGLCRFGVRHLVHGLLRPEKHDPECKADSDQGDDHPSHHPRTYAFSYVG